MLVSFLGAVGSAACAPRRVSTRVLLPAVPAPSCILSLRLSGEQTLGARVQRLPDAWLVSIDFAIPQDGGEGLPVRGLGRVTQEQGELRCTVLETEGDPADPRFDAEVCLDVLDLTAELWSAAAHSARPGETVVQELSVSASARPRRRRTRLARRLTSFSERAEVSLDAHGRPLRLSRTNPGGGREELTASYPGSQTRCLPEASL